jgi:hypothetical protein
MRQAWDDYVEKRNAYLVAALPEAGLGDPREHPVKTEPATPREGQHPGNSR